MSKSRHKNLVSRRELLKSGFYGSMAMSLAPACTTSRPITTRPNILLITLDTTRADRLGCYGYNRQTSPNLDRLAQESVLYTNAIAPSSWTLPSHTSLFTGKFTSSHGARYDPEGPLKLMSTIHGGEDYRVRGMSENEVTLAMILGSAGYSTAAVVGGPWMTKVFGLNKGFSFYDDADILSINGRIASQVTTSAANWLESTRDDPFFLFLNYYDPHSPYTAPGKFYLAFLPKTDSNAKYDAEILYMDHHIGQLLDKLREWNLYDNTWIIITADHGELLGEHGKIAHGDYLYQEEIHIPLFMKYPLGEVSEQRTDVMVQLTDILPMICQRLDLPVPNNIQGAVPPQSNHPIVAETYPLPITSLDGHWRTIFDGDYKFLWNSSGQHTLFNLKQDPSESTNIADKEPQQAKQMAHRLDQYLASLPQPGAAPASQVVDPETTRALKGLGYLK